MNPLVAKVRRECAGNTYVDLLICPPTCPLYGTAEFMFGPDYLAKPVTTYLQRVAWVYLPALPAGQTWVYHFNGTDFGPGPANLTLATPVGEFPLFYRNSLSSSQ